MSLFDKVHADPLYWRWIGPWTYQRRGVPLADVAKLAMDSIGIWHSSDRIGHDEKVGGAIVGALTAVGYFLKSEPASATEIPRTVAQYFSSPNFDVACNTLCAFQRPVFSKYSIFVSDKLVETASCQAVPPSPVDMTIRGFAFLVLFQLDPQYKHWPQLARARDECVHGLRTWPALGSADSRNRSKRIAAQIVRYLDNAT